MKVFLIWKQLLAWILCAFILIATIDRTPDPPAVNPHGKNAHLSCLSKYFDESIHQDERITLYITRESETPHFDSRVKFEVKNCVQLEKLLRQASNTSPPAILL